MKKAGIPIHIFAILTIVTLLLLLAPMIKAAQYDVPSADDYPNGINTYFAWKETHSIPAVLDASFAYVHRVYERWQGSFSAVFLFTMNPMIYGEQYYMIGALVILAMLLVGNTVLVCTIARRLFQASWAQCAVIAVILNVICTQFLPRASQGIYWYTGAVYYTFFYGLACVACSLLIRFLTRAESEKCIGTLVGASLLLFFIGGGNLVTCLTTAVLLVSAEVLLIWLKRSDRKWFLIPLVCFFAAFLLNVIAPGNGKRQNHFAQPGLFRSVLISFQQEGIFFVKWFSLPVIALVVMLIPVLWMVARRTKFRFVLPGLVSLYSVCLGGVMFYAPIYAMTARNLQHLGRITNIIFFGEVLLVIFNLFYWIGWLVQRGKLPERFFPSAANDRYNVVFLVVMLLVFAFGMTQIKWFDTTSISAFRSYRSTQMGSYWHTYKLRLEILKDPEVEDAVLKRFPYRPYVLFFSELSESPDGNKTVARWYGKNSVVIR